MTGLNTHQKKELEEFLHEMVHELQHKNAIPVTQNVDTLVKHLVRVFEKIPELTPELLKNKKEECKNIVMFAATLASNPAMGAEHDPRLLERLTEKFAFIMLDPRHLPPQLRLQMATKLFKDINEVEPNLDNRLEDSKVEQLAQAVLNIKPEENDFLNGAQKAAVQANGVDQFFLEVFLAITFKNPNSSYFEGNDAEKPASSPFAKKTPFDTKLTPPGSS